MAVYAARRIVAAAPRIRAHCCRQHLYDILGEKKPVLPELAVRLGKAFGDGPEVWLRMQAAFDAWHAGRAM